MYNGRRAVENNVNPPPSSLMQVASVAVLADLQSVLPELLSAPGIDLAVTALDTGLVYRVTLYEDPPILHTASYLSYFVFDITSDPESDTVIYHKEWVPMSPLLRTPADYLPLNPPPPHTVLSPGRSADAIRRQAIVTGPPPVWTGSAWQIVAISMRGQPVLLLFNGVDWVTSATGGIPWTVESTDENLMAMALRKHASTTARDIEGATTARDELNGRHPPPPVPTLRHLAAGGAGIFLDMAASLPSPAL